MQYKIRTLDDGSLEVVFDCMPPYGVASEEKEFFSNFDQEMQDAIGTEVYWEDREVFLIPSPEQDTEAKIEEFIAECKKEE